MRRRDLFTRMLAGTALTRILAAQAPQAPGGVYLERPATGTPHKGKVLLALQAHSDDVPLHAAAPSPS
jgi:hypothetical protein